MTSFESWRTILVTTPSPMSWWIKVNFATGGITVRMSFLIGTLSKKHTKDWLKQEVHKCMPFMWNQIIHNMNYLILIGTFSKNDIVCIKIFKPWMFCSFLLRFEQEYDVVRMGITFYFGLKFVTNSFVWSVDVLGLWTSVCRGYCCL